MSPEQNQSRRWPEVLQPVLDFAERLEQNPPIDLLKKSIASLIAVGALAVGVAHAGGETTNTDQLVMTCTDVEDCEQAFAPEPLLLPPNPQPIAVEIVPEAPVPEAPAARVQNEPMRSVLEAPLRQVPTLPELAVIFPAEYGDWQQQVDYIAMLDERAVVTPEDFHNFKYNDQFVNIFADSSEFGTRIIPKLIVPHWTVTKYPAGLAGGELFAISLKNSAQGRLSSNYFIDHKGSTVYRYYDEDTHMTAGAIGMNRFAINIELEAGLTLPTDAAPTVLYDVTPEALEKMVITVTQLARRYNLAISEYTVIGHLAGDMIFVNDTFNKSTGTVKSLRKFDMPQELVTVIIKKAQALDRQLG